MSIINRLRSLFVGDEDKEERDVFGKKSVNIEVKSSKVGNTIVSGIKTSVSIDEVMNKSPVKDGVEENLPIIEEDKNSIDEEIPKVESESFDEEKTHKESLTESVEDETLKTEEDVLKEESLDIEENVSSDEEDNSTDELSSTEKVDDKDKNDKKRDNMTLLTDKELLTDANRDPEFTAEFIDAGIETVKHCFQCGTCGGGCPSGRRTPYKVRQIVRKCLLGLKEDVITDDALWMCTTCYTCQERCPRSVKIVEIIKKARNVAAHAGYMAKPHKMTGVFVINTGHGVPINDAAKALRTKIGLSEVPATTHADAGALEEVQKLCKLTAFDELIGYDEATGGLKE